MTRDSNAAPPILIVSPLREQGDTGVQTHVISFARFLSVQGRTVEVVTPYGRDAWLFYPLYVLRFPLQKIDAGLGVWWYRLSRRWVLQWRLWLRLRDGRAAVVYAQCPLSGAAGLAARAHAGQAVVMVVHFNVSQADEFVCQGVLRDGDWVWRGIRRLEASVLPRLDGMVFVSPYMRDVLHKRIPAVTEVAQEIIPNFVARHLKVRVPTSRAAGAPVRLVCVGTLEPRKNQAYLLEVCAQAAAAGLSFELSVIGEGPDRALLEWRARDLGIGGKVRFLGRVLDAALLLHEFDALIHTARMESFGIVLIEGMAAGLPLFATPVGGVPSVFNDGVEGRYLPLDDAIVAGQILAQVLADPILAERMAASAVERFSACFELSLVARRLTDFLDTVARVLPVPR